MKQYSEKQPLVIKLGGSLYNTAELTLWLKALSRLSKQQSIIIVPGGGPFADQVRQAQSDHQFDDKTAHHMAILAMKQFGLLLLSLNSDCQAFYNCDPLTAPLSVWLPDDSLLDQTSLAQNWDISSDSLALWLSAKLDAERLILVKRVTTHSRSIDYLSLENIIDSGFANLFSLQPVNCQIVHYQQHQQLSDPQHALHQTISLSLP